MFAHSFSVFNNRLLREAIGGGSDGSFLTVILVVLYAAILIALSVYGGHRYMVLWNWFRGRKRQPQPARRFEREELPGLCIQLPVFNERYVVNDLIESVAGLDYPRDRLEIQVLDDSTDDTTEIARDAVARWKARGLPIELHHRTDRSGFKAGALAEGMKHARYDLFAIFDADFRPEPDYLLKLIDHFSDEKVGVVQGRWGHANHDQNMLTRVQAIMLDGHFVLEHPARNRTGLFFNFNGTAGIWRRAAIEAGGGWQADTLTEDLDLSYRAQMEGWRFVYDPDVICPAELPADMNAFKSQQHRWAKGSVQVMLKLLADVLRSRVPFRQKTEAFVHLTGNLAYILMFGMCVLNFPMLMLRARIAEGLVGGILDLSIFLFATASVWIFYGAGQALGGYPDARRRLLALPMMMSVGIGMMFNQLRAVIEALVGHQSPFVRTPKVGVGGSVSATGTTYRGLKSVLPWVECGFGVYYLAAIVYALSNWMWTTLPFLLLFCVGFFYCGISSIRQERAARRPVPAAETAPAGA